MTRAAWQSKPNANLAGRGFLLFDLGGAVGIAGMAAMAVVCGRAAHRGAVPAGDAPMTGAAWQSKPNANLAGRGFLLFDVGGAVGIAGMAAMAAAVRHTVALYRQETLR